MCTIILDQLEEISVARCGRCEMVDARFDERTKRVTIEFADPDGQVAELVAEHRRGALVLPSLDLFEALKWTKDRVFEVRREAMKA